MMRTSFSRWTMPSILSSILGLRLSSLNTLLACVNSGILFGHMPESTGFSRPPLTASWIGIVTSQRPASCLEEQSKQQQLSRCPAPPVQGPSSPGRSGPQPSSTGKRGPQSSRRCTAGSLGRRGARPSLSSRDGRQVLAPLCPASSSNTSSSTGATRSHGGRLSTARVPGCPQQQGGVPARRPQRAVVAGEGWRPAGMQSGFCRPASGAGRPSLQGRGLPACPSQLAVVAGEGRHQDITIDLNLQGSCQAR